ncbi:GTP cyclohydrolase MptA [Candidatus Methanomassiliicoccus intestinalis]|uniref:GTP cyclohydrolase MptA n=1 Tax=Candidatus Methanomassiliicoccus intestinalis TaxID=1406512 RepID=UPI0037DC4454
MVIIKSDVQNRRLDDSYLLTRVGVTNVRKPIKVSRAGRVTTLFCNIDVFVDLPPTQKGSHLSRNLEAINEVINGTLQTPAQGIEVVAAEICHMLRLKHEYATYAEVNMAAEYFTERPGPSGKKTLETFKILAKSISNGSEPLKKTIGVQVVGMTACPCAMETVRELHKGAVVFADDLPVITHNQRNVATLIVETPEECDVEVDGMIDLLESSFSSSTHELLKRDDEAAVVLRAHQNPKFVEDVVRTILMKFVEKYADLPDSVNITIRSESEESIHKHNAFAERTATLGELRRK